MNKTTVEVQALKRHSYDGHYRLAGTIYQAETKDLHVLKLAGLVRVAPSKTKTDTQSKDMRGKS